MVYRDLVGLRSGINPIVPMAIAESRSDGLGSIRSYWAAATSGSGVAIFRSSWFGLGPMGPGQIRSYLAMGLATRRL